MITILQSTIGQKLMSIVGDFTNSSYSKVLLRFESFAIELTNEQLYRAKNSILFDDNEEIAAFSCNKFNSDKLYESAIEGSKGTAIDVDDVVTGVKIVRDHVFVDNVHDFDIDNAVLFETIHYKYTFSKGSWFSEEIFISSDEKESYSVSSEICDLSNDGEYDVTINRETIHI